MEVALLLSSQKPGERESCLSLAIFCSLCSTSKKPPQDSHTVPHIFNLLYCHKAEDKGVWFYRNVSIFSKKKATLKVAADYLFLSVLVLSPDRSLPCRMPSFALFFAFSKSALSISGTESSITF
jgi:hypothetical protein